MPPASASRHSDDSGERLARLEYAAEHSAQDRRDIWSAVSGMRDFAQKFGGKADVFMVKADEVLKRVDEHAAQIAAIKTELAENKGQRTVFHSVVAFGASIFGGLVVHFFPGGSAGH